MRALAIETATTATAVALDDGTGQVVAEVVDADRRHTESLAPAVARLLRARGLAAAELEAVVVDVGPGLYTGLRVGIAFAKGLALAVGVELRGVLSTDVLAAAAFELGASGEVVAVVDARRGEVFSARYAADGGRVGEVTVAAPGALAAELRERPATVVGDGALRYRDVLAQPMLDVVVPPPAAALRLGAAAAAAGVPATPPAELLPWYLREADAVANFAVRDAAR